jgi:TniQ
MTAALLRLPPLRRLPRAPAPLLNETVYSYLWRLASANGLHSEDFRIHLTGRSTRGTEDVTAEDLATVTGYPARTLRYAMLELCGPSDILAMRLAGRPRPDPHDRYRTRRRSACRQCAAARGATKGASVWCTHEDVVCLRHRRWVGSPFQSEQPDLTTQPEIVRANRQHRRLIRLYGRDQVRAAIAAATPICREWRDRLWSDNLSYRRITMFKRQGYETSGDSAATDAATYPEIVALARLFASPYWRQQAMADNLDPQPPDPDIWNTIHVEIQAGVRHLDDIPTDIHLAAAGLLRQGPALTRFTDEIRRTVNPGYQWNPWPHYRRFAPITEWIMNEIATTREPNRYHFRQRPPPPEQFEGPRKAGRR